jgi:hypothetical protein
LQRCRPCPRSQLEKKEEEEEEEAQGEEEEEGVCPRGRLLPERRQLPKLAVHGGRALCAASSTPPTQWRVPPVLCGGRASNLSRQRQQHRLAGRLRRPAQHPRLGRRQLSSPVPNLHQLHSRARIHRGRRQLRLEQQ